MYNQRTWELRELHALEVDEFIMVADMVYKYATISEWPCMDSLQLKDENVILIGRSALQIDSSRKNHYLRYSAFISGVELMRSLI